MDEMQVDVDQRGFALGFGDDVLLPDFFKECFGCVAHVFCYPQGLKPRLIRLLDVRAEARTLRSIEESLADLRRQQLAHCFADLLAHLGS